MRDITIMILSFQHFKRAIYDPGKPLAVLFSHDVVFACQQKDGHAYRGKGIFLHVRLGEHEGKKGIVLPCLGGADLG